MLLAVDVSFICRRRGLIPFFTSPDTNATPIPNAPLPTLTPHRKSTSTTSQEPQQTEFTTITDVAIVLAVLGAGIGLLVYLVKRKLTENSYSLPRA